jgi:hypothetical protein
MFIDSALSVVIILCTLSLTARADVTTGPFRFWINGVLNNTHEYIGPCPVALRFGFWIDDNPHVPATAAYSFSRSDGAINNQTFTARIGNAQGATTVFEDWHLGANVPQFQDFRGWVELDVIAPNSSASRIPFTLHCGADGSGQAGVPTNASGQSFSGVWDLVSNSMNGAPQSFKPNRMAITQNGSQVRIGNRAYPLTQPNVVIYQTFYAGGAGQAGHEVYSAGEADLIDTFKWYLLDDGRLKEEAIFNYRNAYGNHPPGSDVRVMFYRRVGNSQ